jgi:DNA helicase-2/ATP-dependent DNA helicase PcrA
MSVKRKVVVSSRVAAPPVPEAARAAERATEQPPAPAPIVKAQVAEQPTPTPDARRWSGQQQDIFNWFSKGVGHLVVRARAGTGKTTTIIEAISRAPEPSILLAAFNKRIAVELQTRLTNANAEAATLHSIGYGCVRRYWENVRMDDQRADRLSEKVCGQRAPDVIRRLVSKLHTKAREINPHAEMANELYDMAQAFDCVPDDDWQDDGYDLNYVCSCAVRAMGYAAMEKPANGIDFADMIFLPIRNGWLRPKYDLVVIDEAQDMSASQLEIAQGVLKPGGRMCVVGDDRQALYGFRGADTQSIDRLKRSLDAQEMGLNTTYRCGLNIVREAQRLVPDILPLDGIHEGKVSGTTLDSMLASAQVGDYVLSRTNAPLVRTALSLIRAGRRTRVEGRDIGSGLKAIARRLAKGAAADSIPQFLRKLVMWEAKEADRAEKANLPGKVDMVHDQADTLRALADGAASVREIDVRIDSLFSDTGGASIVCSSVHRAKGLEADRVFILQDTLNPPVSCECGHRHLGGACRCGCNRYRPSHQRQLEEDNIAYVAITRAKQELVYVSGGV